MMVSRIIPAFATAALAVVALVKLLSQCRKPRWWPGRLFVATMNVRHAAVTKWGLAHVRIDRFFTILDVGCGGGETIHRLAEMACAGKICGIDHSDVSVAVARSVNAAAIETSRVEIQRASVSRLPFPANTFDLVSAVETHYYWPAPTNDLREILRVMKPGGHFVMIAEAYSGERFARALAIPMKLLRARYFTEHEHVELLTAAGFVDAGVDVEPRKGWICAVGRKPGQP